MWLLSFAFFLRLAPISPLLKMLLHIEKGRELKCSFSCILIMSTAGQNALLKAWTTSLGVLVLSSSSSDESWASAFLFPAFLTSIVKHIIINSCLKQILVCGLFFACFRFTRIVAHSILLLSLVWVILSICPCILICKSCCCIPLDCLKVSFFPS